MRSKKKALSFAFLSAALITQLGVRSANAAVPTFTTSGLVLRYDINNASSYSVSSPSVINDLTSNGINATTVNSPTYSSSNGGSLTFTGSSSQYAYTAAITTATLPMTTGYSTFMWVKPTGNGIILDERGQAAGGGGWQDANIEISGNQLYFDGWNGSENYVLSSIQPGLNNWMYIGFTFSGSTVTGYVNGAAAGTFTRTSGNLPASNSRDLYYTIGQSDSTSLTNAYGNFLFGSLHVYNGALTSTQISDNYNALKSRFSTPTITSFTPSTGGSGTTVTLTGTNMFGTTAVAFNGIAAASFTVLSDTQTTAVVPNGSATGKITLTSGGNTATSTTDYTSYVGPATVSLSLTSGGTTTSKSKATSLTAALNTPGTVTFYANGRVINRCQAVVTATTTATCNWLPLTNSRVPITAYINPSSSSYSAVTSSPLYIQVNKRNTAR